MVKLTLGLIVQETVHLGGGTVVGADGETVVGSVQDQVLTHDGQTDQTEVSTRQRTRRSADIDAGQTGASVSCQFCQQGWNHGLRHGRAVGDFMRAEGVEGW